MTAHSHVILAVPTHVTVTRDTAALAFAILGAATVEEAARIWTLNTDQRLAAHAELAVLTPQGTFAHG